MDSMNMMAGPLNGSSGSMSGGGHGISDTVPRGGGGGGGGGGLLPMGMNMSSLLGLIQAMAPHDRQLLLHKLGMGSEDDLRQLMGGAISPARAHSEAEKLLYPEYRAHKLLRIYIPPFLLLLGTIGNICSFLILRHKAMARQSTNHFLAALAVTDSLVLYVGLCRKWLGDLTGFDLQTEHEWLCKVIVMLGYTCSNVSVWIIVAVTIERYVVVCHPLRATTVCNVTRAKRVVLVIVAAFVLINLHFLWTASISWTLQDGSTSTSPSPITGTGGGGLHSRGVPQCGSQEGHEFLITAIWPWVDAFLYGFGPFLIISVLNVVIIVHIVKATSGRVILQNRCLSKSPTRPGSGSGRSSGGGGGGGGGGLAGGSSLYQLMQLAASASATSLCSSAGNVSSSNNNNVDAVSKSSMSCSSLMVPHSNGGGGGGGGGGSHHHPYNNNNNSNNNNNNGGGGGGAGGGSGMSVSSYRGVGAGGPGGGGGERGGGGGSGGGGRRRVTSDKSLRITVMLLTVSFTFLLTTLPMNVSVILSAFWNRKPHDLATMSKVQLIFTVAEMLMYLNHSVNFFLYCATGNKFRSEMVRMVCGKAARATAAHLDHSQHIYCSRACGAASSQGNENKNFDETVL